MGVQSKRPSAGQLLGACRRKEGQLETIPSSPGLHILSHSLSYTQPDLFLHHHYPYHRDVETMAVSSSRLPIPSTYQQPSPDLFSHNFTDTQLDEYKEQDRFLPVRTSPLFVLS
jgi:hypothetical protein